MDEKAARIYFWDNAKGILIFLVVYGHFILPYRSLPAIRIVIDLIYLFHMPAFVFISGHLSQFVSDSRKAILRLCVAYLIFNLPMMIYAFFFEGIKPSLLTPYYSYWYLLALVAWRLIAPVLSRSSEALIFSTAISIFVGFWGEINNLLALSRIIGLFPFFLAGYMISELDLRYFLSPPKKIHILLAGCMLSLTLFTGAYLSTKGITMSDLLFFPYEAPIRFIYRIIIFLFTFVILICMAVLLTKKQICLLSKWGKNSLTIYVLHRYITILVFALYPLRSDSLLILSASLLGSLITLFAFGNDSITQKLNQMLAILADAVGNPKAGKRAIRLSLYIFLLCNIAFVVSIKMNSKNDFIHKVLNAKQEQQINKAISISFVGDIILLRDQIRRAYRLQTNEYDFDPLFAYAKRYFQDSDFSIGVLEGPLAGKEKGYSTSNYADGIPIYLNYPDSLADSIKRAGIDLLTIGNNHLLDMEVEGAMRTMEVLSDKEIQYVGAYRNRFEKNNTKIIEIEGLRVAVLAYTYPPNYYSEDFFFKTNSSIISVIVDSQSRYFNNAASNVRRDFESAKAKNPDLIIVLAHMGTQFMHKTDRTQETWNKIFISEGADIILGAHSHAVQPVEFRTIKENGRVKRALIVNSPGNFVNSYVEHDGDATSIVKIFIDPESKSVLCAGVVPMFTQIPYQGQHRALPIYDIICNPSIYNQISSVEMKRVTEIHSLITEIMLGAQLSLDQAQEIYYLFPEGYYRQSVAGINLDEQSHQSSVYKILKKCKHVVFVGDSVTLGSKNGGYGWYEPLIRSLPELLVNREAWPSATTLTLLDNSDEISSHAADLYVIAIGTNDIRYRRASICAMTAQQYVENIDKLVNVINRRRPDANFIFISPWPSLPNDPYIRIPFGQRKSLSFDYTKSLEEYCQENGYLFVDPASKILSAIDLKISGYYLLDHIHPNAAEGLKLYSKAFLSPKK